MTSQFETLHPRSGTGRFAEKHNSAPAGTLLMAPPVAAYPTVPFDTAAAARLEDEGENQVCACGNDSTATGWRAANAAGRLSPDDLGDDDDNGHNICAACGLVYRNGDLFGMEEHGATAAAFARYDISDPTFQLELARYDHVVYGDPNPDAAAEAAASRTISDEARSAFPTATRLTFATCYTDDGSVLSLSGIIDADGTTRDVDGAGVGLSDDERAATERIDEAVFEHSGAGQDGSQLPGMTTTGDDNYTFELGPR